MMGMETSLNGKSVVAAPNLVKFWVVYLLIVDRDAFDLLVQSRAWVQVLPNRFSLAIFLALLTNTD